VILAQPATKNVKETKINFLILNTNGYSLRKQQNIHCQTYKAFSFS